MIKNRGFTLIELLVVIAIIGILSSVVLAALNTSRGKGNSARYKEQFTQARIAAEIFYQENNNYNTTNNPITGTACANGMWSNALGSASGMYKYAQIVNYPGAAAGDMVCETPANGSTYAMSIKLSQPEGSITYWCLDSRGTIKGRTSQLNASNSSDNCDSP